MASEIHNYALIGDCETAALVGRGGSIDWLCWPSFDSAACFAALLGNPENGRWLMAPNGRVHRTSRRYREESLVLDTTFETEDGVCTVTDFMPIRGTTSDLVRIVSGERGTVSLTSDMRLQFDYGRLAPWIKPCEDGAWEAISGPHAVTLHAPGEASTQDGQIVQRFQVRAGERMPFILTYRASHHPPKPPVDPETALNETEHAWRNWSSRCEFSGPRREAVVRSLITIKALTYAPTGGIIAAPTTSLPEKLGGQRNWDYRFCWLRDATLTLLTLFRAGYSEEAAAWRDWLLRAAAGMPRALQPIYGIAGEHRLEEQTLPWLPGYFGAQPVRTGNAAHRQIQLDVFGQVLDAMHQARQAGISPEPASWHLQRSLVEHVSEIWDQPDNGIWEVRSQREHFTHSKVMACVALDRAVRAYGIAHHDAATERWRALRDQIHQTICQKGYDAEINAFVRSFGSKEVDGSALLLPIVGFISFNDPRMIGTVHAIERRLMQDGFVRRYDTDSVSDGLPEDEGTFLACTCWYADNLAMQGRRKEAEAVFERILSVRNDVGLLAEEYDPRSGRLLGNFPQALSHLSLVDTAFNLSAHGSVRARSKGEREEQAKHWQEHRVSAGE